MPRRLCRLRDHPPSGDKEHPLETPAGFFWSQPMGQLNELEKSSTQGDKKNPRAFLVMSEVHSADLGHE